MLMSKAQAKLENNADEKDKVMASAELPNVCAAQNQCILFFVLKNKGLNYKRHSYSFFR